MLGRKKWQNCQDFSFTVIASQTAGSSPGLCGHYVSQSKCYFQVHHPLLNDFH